MRQVETMLQKARIVPSSELVRRIERIPRVVCTRQVRRSLLAAIVLIGGCTAIPGARQAVFRVLDVPGTVTIMTDDGDVLGTTSLTAAGIITNLPIPAFVPEGYELVISGGPALHADTTDGEVIPGDLDAVVRWRRRRDNAFLVIWSMADPDTVESLRTDVEWAAPGMWRERVEITRRRHGVTGVFHFDEPFGEAPFVAWIHNGSALYLIGTHETSDTLIEIARSM